jgi:Na+/H+-translocating membrane pyrophosphatase
MRVRSRAPRPSMQQAAGDAGSSARVGASLLALRKVGEIRAAPGPTLTISARADNVGDNVGDIAGMGADLFGSFAEATCAALVISSVSALGSSHLYCAMQYPLLISACGIVVCLVTAFIATDLKPARMVSEIESTLKYQLIISTIIATPVRSLPLRSVRRHVPAPARGQSRALSGCAGRRALGWQPLRSSPAPCGPVWAAGRWRSPCRARWPPTRAGPPG